MNATETDPIDKAHLATQHRHRTRQRLDDALATIVEHWPATTNPPRPEGTPTRTVPTSRPPTSTVVLAVRDNTWRDLRSWGQLVMEQRDLHLGPRATGPNGEHTGPDLALFLARHTDWLAAHDAGPDAATELTQRAKEVRDLAEGNVTRRYQVGACPEPVFIDDVETGRCAGTLTAIMHQGDDLLPKIVRCDRDHTHAWTPGQWPSLGRRLGLLSPIGVDRLLARLGGYRA